MRDSIVQEEVTKRKPLNTDDMKTHQLFGIMGQQEVSFTWDELKSYLVKNPPFKLPPE